MLRPIKGEYYAKFKAMENKAKHSEMLRASGRTYFFDLKEASNGNPYLTVTESRKNKEGEFLSNRVMIFKEDFDNFREKLSEMVEKVATPQ